jgi:chloramphenicol-sensitive protein RarD
VTGKTREGYLYGLIAYGWWGLVPLYFRALEQVPPLEILAHRIVWSLLFLGAVLALTRRWEKIWACLRHGPSCRTLLLTAALIAVNWYVYITAVERRVIVQASLGYFLTPLVSVVLGMLFFKERLRRLQWLALLLALMGTGNLILAEKSFPWIALTLACSFSLYGLLRKRIPVDGLVGLSVETVVLLPFAAGYLVYLGTGAALSLGTKSWSLDVLLLCSGVVTAVPLLCFGQATQRLPLSSLGFMQYLSPSIQFVLAVLVLNEPMDPHRLESFAWIWLGLALFIADSWRAHCRTPLGDKDVPA